MLEELILRIVREERVSSQKALIKRIEEISSKVIEQSLVSRKLKKLNIIKENGYYKVGEKKSFFSKRVIRYFNIAEPNLIIIKTTPGMADSIALIIDNEIETNARFFTEVAGTIAGDDTVFIAVKNPKALKSTKNQLENLLI